MGTTAPNHESLAEKHNEDKTTISTEDLLNLKAWRQYLF